MPIGAVLVFPGFDWLVGDLSGIPLRIEADPEDEAIQKAAWAEVAALAAILSRQVGQGQRFGLPRTREPRHLLRRLGVPPRALQPERQPTIFQVALERFRDE